MPRSLITVFVLTLGLLFSTSASAQAPAKASWECLPEGTVVALHVPGGKAFADALRQRTQFGAAMFAPAKIEQFITLIKDEAGEGWGEMVRELERYDLTTEDFKHVFDGPMGMGMVITPRADQSEPLFVMLMWFEPGEDRATRMHAGLLQAIEDEAKENDAPHRRIDTTIAGRAVSHLSFPEEDFDIDMNWELPEGFFEMTEEQRDAHWAEQIRKQEQAKLVEMDRTHVMLTRMGGRLVMAFTPPQSSAAVRALRENNPDADIPWDRLTGVEETTRVLGQFLSAHDDNSRGFVGKVMATPGINSAATPGDVMLDVLFDVDALIDLARQAVNANDPEEAQKFEQGLRIAGVTTGHSGLYRMSLDGTVMRGGLFFGVKGPRQGLMALLDQPAVEAAPPAWVSAQTMSYVHGAFDLGAAYLKIKEIAVEIGGQEAQDGFMQAEAGVQMFTGAALPEVLRSIGTRHTILGMGMKMVEVDQMDFEAEPDPNTGMWPTKKVEQPMQLMGFVWQVGDEPLWQRLMQALGGFAAMTGAPMQPTEEQGFTGYRLDEGGMQMGLMLGRGHLVLGVGPGVTEQVLTMLRNTPDEANQLRNSERFRDAQRLLDLRPGLAFSVEDAGRNLGSTLDMVFKGMEMSGELDPELFQAIRSLLPTAQEMEKMASTNAGVVYMTDEGLVAGTALRLTPAQ